MPTISHATYLDQNSGAPLHPSVVEALFLFLKDHSPLLANPSSQHSEGRRARKLVTKSQEDIFRSLGIQPNSANDYAITFLSSGTDANQTAIRSSLEPFLKKGEKPHWILSPIEHPSVQAMVTWFESRGGEVSRLPISSEGQVRIEALESFIRPETRLVSVMAANNETGITSHIQSILKITQTHCIPLHTDCIALWGKSEINLLEMNPEFLCLSPYKVGGLSGLGILVHRKSAKLWNPIIGPQQGGRRGGGENLLGIFAAGIAARSIQDQIQETLKISNLRNRLEDWLVQEIPSIQINGNGPDVFRLGHVLHLTFPGYSKNLSLATQCDLEGISVSSGSACSSGAAEPSHVLLALGMNRLDALNSLRISLGLDTQWDACLKLGTALKRIISHAGSQ